MDKKNTPVIVAAAILALAGTFYGGMTYGTQKAATDAASARAARQGGQQGQFAGRGGQGARGGFGGAVAGEILSKDDKGITVKLSDGGSKIVLLADSTMVSKSQPATKDDLQVGTFVIVTGSTNTDGSVTAKMVRLGEPMPKPADAPAAAPVSKP